MLSSPSQGSLASASDADITSVLAATTTATSATSIRRRSKSAKKGPHRFHKHVDAWDVASATRQISIILYLNDVAVGGETIFADLDVDVRPKEGRLIVFPSSYMFQHEGMPPISNKKYVLVSWLHFDGPSHGYRTFPLSEGR